MTVPIPTPPPEELLLIYFNLLIDFTEGTTDEELVEVMTFSDILISTGHMFLHFQNLFTIVDEDPPTLVNVVPGIPEERELGGSHPLHLGVIDGLIGGEVVNTHSVKPVLIDLFVIGEISKKVDCFHIHFISHYKDTTFF